MESGPKLDPAKTCKSGLSCIVFTQGASTGLCLPSVSSCSTAGACATGRVCLSLSSGSGVCANNCTTVDNCPKPATQCEALQNGTKVCAPAPVFGPNAFGALCKDPAATSGCKQGLFCLRASQSSHARILLARLHPNRNHLSQSRKYRLVLCPNCSKRNQGVPLPLWSTCSNLSHRFELHHDSHLATNSVSPPNLPFPSPQKTPLHFFQTQRPLGGSPLEGKRHHAPTLFSCAPLSCAIIVLLNPRLLGFLHLEPKKHLPKRHRPCYTPNTKTFCSSCRILGVRVARGIQSDTP